MQIQVSAWAIRNPVVSVVIFVILTLVGIYSFSNLPITRFPNIDAPFVNVIITQSGAAPAELETQVAKKVEDAVAGISDIKHISTKVTDGTSVTTIEFRLEVNSDRALNDVKDSITKIRQDLPRTIDEPQVQRVNIAGLPILTFAAYAPQMSLEDLSWFIDDVVTRDLQNVKDVSAVERIGGSTREIMVALKPDRLLSFGITAADVNRQLRASHVNLAGGRGEIGGQEQAIRTLGGTKTVADLASTKISIGGGRKVQLDEIGEIRDTAAETRTFARLDGQPVVAFSISRSRGASDVELAEKIEKRVESLNKLHPEVDLKLIDSFVTYTKGNYHAAMSGLYEGAILAIIVVFLFLRDWRATLISGIALPLSVIPTFWAISLLGFSLNLVSLLALTLATGILVDDAIVEVENISRHMGEGKTPYRASIVAADEIGLAVIAITSTLIAIFAPVSFMGGIPGQYFKQFGLVVASAVFFSLLVARLITPILCAYFLREHKTHEAQMGKLMTRYTGLIQWIATKKLAFPVPAFITNLYNLLQTSFFKIMDATLFPLIATLTKKLQALTGSSVSFSPSTPSLNFNFTHVKIANRYVTVILGLFIFFISLKGMGLLPSGFIPHEDQARVLFVMEMPPGARLEDSQRKSDEVTKALRKIEGVASVFIDGGRTLGSSRDIRRSSIVINYTHKSKRKKTQKELEEESFQTLAAISDIRYWKLNPMNGFRALTLLVTGPDPDKAAAYAVQLSSEMRGVPILQGALSTVALDRPEMIIKPKNDLMVDLGVTTESLAETVRVGTLGDVGPNLAKFEIGTRQIPIRVQLEEATRGELNIIEALKVPATKGAVPLGTIADIYYAQGPTSIDRYDRERKIAVEADLFGTDALGEAVKAVEALPTAKTLMKQGYEIKPFGDAEIMGEIFASFATAMGAGLLMVFAVLILLFGSFLHPITILLSLPLSLGGVIVALLVTQKPMSMPVVIGLLMLMGIVTKNAIMLVDFAVERMADGMNREEAIIDAGVKRARPIIMTTIAMAAGMIPSALGLSDGGEFRSPMAVAVIGGLIVSTFLSLVFVPAFFLVMDDVSQFFTRISARFLGAVDEPEDYVKGH